MGTNFDYINNVTNSLPEPLAKMLFMANLGLTDFSMGYETASSTDSISRPTRKSLRGERAHPYGILHCRLVQVHENISRMLESRQEVLQMHHREQPMHNMLLWLMKLPKRLEPPRAISTSALRCNECYMCEGVEYPCVRCLQQFHQECHIDQGRRKPHRLCPRCTRTLS